MKDSNIVQFNNTTLERLTEKFVGKSHNGIEIIEIVGKKNNKGAALAKSICFCGNKFLSSAIDIIRGHTKSCGCLKKKHAYGINFMHGESTGKSTQEYRVWHYMKDKVLNKSEKSLHRYRTRYERRHGASICERWLVKKMGYLNFIEDMGKKPHKRSMLKRKDNTKEFCKDNCYWKEPKQKTLINYFASEIELSKNQEENHEKE